MSDEDPTAIETFADSTLEIDHGGDYIVDTTEALGGDVYIKLSSGRGFSVEVGGETVFEVTENGGSGAYRSRRRLQRAARVRRRAKDPAERLLSTSTRPTLCHGSSACPSTTTSAGARHGEW